MSRPTLVPASRKVAAFVLVLLLLPVVLWFAWKRSQERGSPQVLKLPAEDLPPAASLSNGPASQWTQFRGSDQGSAAPEQVVPLTWSESVNVVWKSELPGAGLSSPVIAEDKIWITAEARDGRSLGVVALDKVTGRRVLHQEVIQLPNVPTKHKMNTLASPTPVVDGEHLFVAFGTHGVACLRTTDGKLLWKNTGIKFDDEEKGPGGSPILADGLLVMNCDGVGDRFIVALKRSTGEVAWKTERSNPIAQAIPYRKAFSTPLMQELNGVRQIISSSSFRLFGYDPKTGRELWSVETPGFCPVPVPLVRSNWIFTCTGYNQAQLWAFESIAPGQPPRMAWKTTRSVPLIASPVLVGDHLYMVAENGIASCLEAATGRMIWNERIGGKYWASVLHAHGRIYCFAEEGKTTVLAASPQFKVLAKNRLDGEILATPAVADHSLFLRTRTHMYRLQTMSVRP